MKRSKNLNSILSGPLGQHRIPTVMRQDRMDAIEWTTNSQASSDVGPRGADVPPRAGALEHHFALERSFPVRAGRAQDIVNVVADRAGITKAEGRVART